MADRLSEPRERTLPRSKPCVPCIPGKSAQYQHAPLLSRVTQCAGKKKKTKKPQKKSSEQVLPAAQEAEQSGPEVQLLQSSASDQPVDPGTPNSEAWRPPAALSVGQEVVSITYNPPTVTSLEVPPRLMPGFPVLATVEVSYAAAEQCEWQWLRVPASATQGAVIFPAAAQCVSVFVAVVCNALVSPVHHGASSEKATRRM